MPSTRCTKRPKWIAGSRDRVRRHRQRAREHAVEALGRDRGRAVAGEEAAALADDLRAESRLARRRGDVVDRFVRYRVVALSRFAFPYQRLAFNSSTSTVFFASSPGPIAIRSSALSRSAPSKSASRSRPSSARPSRPPRHRARAPTSRAPPRRCAARRLRGRRRAGSSEGALAVLPGRAVDRRQAHQHCVWIKPQSARRSRPCSRGA